MCLNKNNDGATLIWVPRWNLSMVLVSTEPNDRYFFADDIHKCWSVFHKDYKSALHDSRNGLASNRRQAFAWANDESARNHRVTIGLNERTFPAYIHAKTGAFWSTNSIWLEKKCVQEQLSKFERSLSLWVSEHHSSIGLLLNSKRDRCPDSI